MVEDGRPVTLDKSKSVEPPTSSYTQNSRKDKFKNMNNLALFNQFKLLGFSVLLLEESWLGCVDDLASSSTRINSKKDKTETQSEKWKINLDSSPTEF